MLGAYRLERRAGQEAFSLYRGERELLADTPQVYQGHGLSAQDCEALGQLRSVQEPVRQPPPQVPPPLLKRRARGQQEPER